MDNLILSQIPVEDLIALIKTAVREEIAAGHPTVDPFNAEKPITTKELCKYLGVTEPTILRWRKKGKIPFFCIGSAVRFRKNEVIKALEKKGRFKSFSLQKADS